MKKAHPGSITESQNVRGWKGPLWVTQPNPLPKQGHPEQAAQDRVQAALEYLQRRRLHNLPGQEKCRGGGFLLQTPIAGHGVTLQESKNDFLLKPAPVCKLQTPKDWGQAGLRLPSASQMGTGEEINGC